jgi:signal transduction histidine kinase
MNSIRFRLASTLFLGFIALLGSASFLIFLSSRGILVADFDSRLFAKAQAVLSSISQKGEELDVDWMELPQEVNQRRHSHDAIQIFDNSGKAFFNDSALSKGPAVASNAPTFDDIILPTGRFRELTLSFLPRVEEEDLSSTPTAARKNCTLILATDRASLDHTLRKLALILVVMTSTTSLLSLGLVVVVLRRGLRPLHALGDAVANIKPESLGQIIPIDRLPEELAPIAVKLNDLLQSLDVSFARERRFSADISHELRTPVAELKTLSEVMLQEVAHAPQFHQAFEHTLNIACQMESLVSVLLEMVRHEEGRKALTLTTVDLASIINTIQQKYEGKAAEKEVLLNDIPEADGFDIQSEPWLLMVIFANLFDNAVEYSPPGSQVEVELHRDEKSPYVAITNPAANLSPSDLPHIFERFWRKDKARGESNHFGIGLALTRTLCQRLGIHLTVSMAKGNLVRFTLYLPTKGASNEN